MSVTSRVAASERSTAPDQGPEAGLLTALKRIQQFWGSLLHLKRHVDDPLLLQVLAPKFAQA